MHKSGNLIFNSESDTKQRVEKPTPVMLNLQPKINIKLPNHPQIQIWSSTTIPILTTYIHHPLQRILLLVIFLVFPSNSATSIVLSRRLSRCLFLQRLRVSASHQNSKLRTNFEKIIIIIFYNLKKEKDKGR